MVYLLLFLCLFKGKKSDDTADAKSPSNLPVRTEKTKGMLIILEGKYTKFRALIVELFHSQRGKIVKILGI